MLGVRGSKVLVWIDRGELLAINAAERPDGRPRWKISRESFDAFLLSRANRKSVSPTRRRRAAAEVIEFF
jgi:hypothetical protein